MTTTTFKRLRIEDWRQFQSVDLELHPRLTVLTGANGSGKSTLLGLFSQHFGWSRSYLSTPHREKSGGYKYSIGRRLQRIRGATASPTQSSILEPGSEELGTLEYDDNKIATLFAPSHNNAQYQVTLVNKCEVSGVYVSSHRPTTAYQQVANIPTNALTAATAYDSYFSETVQRFLGSYTQFGPTYRLKESLISMATFGAGNEFVQGNKAALNAFLGFQRVLHEVLPESLGFQEISIRTPDVVLVTSSGEFMIDAASGGVMALIDLAWQVHLFSLKAEQQGSDRFSVVIDEPENHLHPSMQRSLLASLVRAFPAAQFIIATHSPFMVSSVRDSFVYVLDYVDSFSVEEGSVSGSPSRTNRRVVSKKLDSVNRAGPASEILRNVLGVPATIPEWVETDLSQIVDEYRGKDISYENLQSLRTRLDELGFGEMYPQALGEWAKNQ